MRGVVILDSRGIVVWSTKPAVGRKEDYMGVSAWEYAATLRDAEVTKMAWLHAMTSAHPVQYQMRTDPKVADGAWIHVLERIDATPLVVGEWREAVDNPLAKRELEIAKLLASDWKSSEIASKLGISPKTVETVRARVFAKLGIRGVAGLAKWLIRAGLIEA